MNELFPVVIFLRLMALVSFVLLLITLAYTDSLTWAFIFVILVLIGMFFPDMDHHYSPGPCPDPPANEFPENTHQQFQREQRELEGECKDFEHKLRKELKNVR